MLRVLKAFADRMACISEGFEEGERDRKVGYCGDLGVDFRRDLMGMDKIEKQLGGSAIEFVIRGIGSSDKFAVGKDVVAALHIDIGGVMSEQVRMSFGEVGDVC